MARLKKIHKELIVMSLAENYEPTEVQKRLRRDYNIDVSLQQIGYYNPELSTGYKLAKEWKSLYWQKKEAYRKELATHPTTDKAYRIGLMDKAAHKYMRDEEYMAMCKVLDQIAKECGGYYEDMDEVEGGGEGQGYTSIQAIMYNINQKIDQQNILENNQIEDVRSNED